MPVNRTKTPAEIPSAKPPRVTGNAQYRSAIVKASAPQFNSNGFAPMLDMSRADNPSRLSASSADTAKEM
jgi:hypothetical protein